MFLMTLGVDENLCILTFRMNKQLHLTKKILCKVGIRLVEEW